MSKKKTAARVVVNTNNYKSRAHLEEAIKRYTEQGFHVTIPLIDGKNPFAS